MALVNKHDLNLTPVNLVEKNDRPGGVTLVNTYNTNRASDPMDLVELARTVQKGNEFTRATAGSKLTVIADQIRYLQEQARKVLEEARRDTMLHQAACNIVRKPGQTYYLYERESGQKYFSLLSPQEWGSTCPHDYIGGFRLELDMSWTPLNDVDKRSQEIAMIDKVLKCQKALTDIDSSLGVGGQETSWSKLPENQKVTDISDRTTTDISDRTTTG